MGVWAFGHCLQARKMHIHIIRTVITPKWADERSNGRIVHWARYVCGQFQVKSEFDRTQAYKRTARWKTNHFLLICQRLCAFLFSVYMSFGQRVCVSEKQCPATREECKRWTHFIIRPSGRRMWGAARDQPKCERLRKKCVRTTHVLWHFFLHLIRCHWHERAQFNVLECMCLLRYGGSVRR